MPYFFKAQIMFFCRFKKSIGRLRVLDVWSALASILAYIALLHRSHNSAHGLNSFWSNCSSHLRQLSCSILWSSAHCLPILSFTWLSDDVEMLSSGSHRPVSGLVWARSASYTPLHRARVVLMQFVANCEIAPHSDAWSPKSVQKKVFNGIFLVSFFQHQPFLSAWRGCYSSAFHLSWFAFIQSILIHPYFEWYLCQSGTRLFHSFSALLPTKIGNVSLGVTIPPHPNCAQHAMTSACFFSSSAWFSDAHASFSSACLMLPGNLTDAPSLISHQVIY